MKISYNWLKQFIEIDLPIEDISNLLTNIGLEVEQVEKYESIMDTLNNFSGIKRYYEKRKIFSAIEDDLLAKYDYSIRKLTKRQGRILIRLIDREANRTSYEIIKDFRNIFTAGFWQITARIFGHNLKTNYNPLKGEDRMIEYIIGRIET